MILSFFATAMKFSAPSEYSRSPFRDPGIIPPVRYHLETRVVKNARGMPTNSERSRAERTRRGREPPNAKIPVGNFLTNGRDVRRDGSRNVRETRE